MNPLKQWRNWLLLALLIGPVLVYLGLGMLWLWERGWVVLGLATTIWVLAGVAFAVLASRWTKREHPVLPPLDWESPQTFTPRDLGAWRIVKDAAEQGESLSFEALSTADCYIDSGRSLLKDLAAHYRPGSANPIDEVPLIELLTALELAAEDLSGLCRQVPGGDLVTLSHYRTAMQVAGYIAKANDLYAYFLPFLSPVGGVARWGTREWVTKPAWKSMQQNMLRWFYEAYVNRLGVHLIELLSGRLAIGAHQYRKLTRRGRDGARSVPDAPLPLTICVAGADGSGKSRVASWGREGPADDFATFQERAEGRPIARDVYERLRAAQWIEAPAYTTWKEHEERRDRARRQSAVAAAVSADLLVLVVDLRRASEGADVAFAGDWDHWFADHPQSAVPPTLIVVLGAEAAEFGDEWRPPYDWTGGQGPRETAVRNRLDGLRTRLPSSFSEFLVLGPSSGENGEAARLLLAVAALAPRADRIAMLRRLVEMGGHSKAGRLVRQVGQRGWELLGGLRSRAKARGEKPS